MDQYYQVGKIVNTHGLRGEVRVFTVSDFKEERYQVGNQLFFFKEEDSQDIQPLTIVSYRPHKQFDLLTFEGYSSINDAEKLKGGLLKVKAEDRSDLSAGEFYYDQIIGCQVFTDEGFHLGEVTSILTPGANDVWVVQQEGSKKEILLPYIEQVVRHVDVQNNKIIVHVIDGLLE